jgi:high-affinity K+ transport system ATPase subunit B
MLGFCEYGHEPSMEAVNSLRIWETTSINLSNEIMYYAVIIIIIIIIIICGVGLSP